jgi:hypothetical protein
MRDGTDLSSACEGSCSHCGSRFRRRHSGHRYCSSTCQERATDAVRASRVVRPSPVGCAECGSVFQPRRPDHRYCRRLCSIRGRARTAADLKIGERPCEACGRTFQQHRVGHKFCSSRCSERTAHKRLRESRTDKMCRSCRVTHPRSQFTRQPWRCDACVQLQEDRLRRCSACGEVRSFDAFSASAKLGQQSRCKDCSKEAERIRALDPAEKRRARSRRLIRAFGIDADQFDQLLESQGGGCAICGDVFEDRLMHVDHDHSCCPGMRTCGGCIRGICCRSCNQALGFLKDQPARAEAAARYLRRHQHGRSLEDQPM